MASSVGTPASSFTSDIRINRVTPPSESIAFFECGDISAIAGPLSRVRISVAANIKLFAGDRTFVVITVGGLATNNVDLLTETNFTGYLIKSQVFFCYLTDI